MVKYRLSKANPQDKEWLYQLHKNTLGPYATQVYGWDERLQRNMFEERFQKGNDFIITINEVPVGMISLVEKEDNINILRIEIAPERQNCGIGTIVIKDIMEQAKDKSKDVVLRVLKVNPAKKLYDRLGFETTSEDDTHYYMKWSH